MLSLPAALIVGHPGHELRLFRWLEIARPVVCVLTDGSGAGHARIASSRELIAATGSTPGPVLGAFTDTEIYDAMMQGHVATVVAATKSIADSLIEQNVRCVVADEFEFYNPTHDLCSVIATLATARAQGATGTVIERYDYAITTAASGPGIVFELSADDVERKIATAYAFAHLRNDVNELLATVGIQDLAREILRPVSMSIRLPVPIRQPYYETHGEERVRAGRYRTVLRYQKHFVPFVYALAAEFGYEVAEAERAASS